MKPDDFQHAGINFIYTLKRSIERLEGVDGSKGEREREKG